MKFYTNYNNPELRYSVPFCFHSLNRTIEKAWELVNDRKSGVFITNENELIGIIAFDDRLINFKFKLFIDPNYIAEFNNATVLP